MVIGTLTSQTVRFTELWVLSHFSRVWLFATLWAVALQAPLSMGLSLQKFWSGLPFPSQGDLPDPGIEPRPPALQADSLPSEPPPYACIFAFLCSVFTSALFQFFGHYCSLLTMFILPEASFPAILLISTQMYLPQGSCPQWLYQGQVFPVRYSPRTLLKTFVPVVILYLFI